MGRLEQFLDGGTLHCGCDGHPFHAGAHPYAVYNYYDYDPRQLKCYHDSAEDDRTYHAYLDQYVYGVKSHTAYLEEVGGAARQNLLRADPAYGYRPDLKRRRLDG